MSYVLSAVAVLVVAIVLMMLVNLNRSRQRTRAATVDEPVMLEARGVTARIFVDASVLAGPAAGKINRAQADLVLTGARLLIATHHGRLLELDANNGGSVRCTGPGRLVIEGERRRVGGPSKVRVEILTSDAELWASTAQQAIGSSRSALAG
ncbi:MAG: hypothetical protein GY913_23570 [Proteobacteria bacterium]|nr:hypothetical protein [Pseudomonadota bacterium]MCP4919893.1 hypothetical protein [Pseudomonadota bacterium]